MPEIANPQLAAGERIYMKSRVNRQCAAYREMFVHTAVFEVATAAASCNAPGPKWKYMMAIRYSAVVDERMYCDCAVDEDDYFTEDAASQAALYYGRVAIDLVSGLP
ncbi:hypothetical protein [Cupriavidus pauculus]|uniref:hypothetical protein n=1 Tax=Cupriavidus pauculus TaxID=82633 RepID=UPI001EE2409A|nr:hypothetical protein [Cupriavidus pauculus]GJG98172.1 hypothetical protein CBA19C6_26805 [Cupriavidus pauculus]